MVRRESPRPTFEGATPIPYEDASRHLWGDSEAGDVADWIYASTDKIHQLVFSLPPGESFRHSSDNKTVFAADEVLYVLSGTMVLANPETGDMCKLGAGEAVFFRRDTWHHGFSYATEELRVLEYFAPPPATGTSSAYARTRPDLDVIRYGDDSVIGHWVPGEDRSSTLTVVREQDYQWRLEGSEASMLVGLLASTEFLTVGRASLLPGAKGGVEKHNGDECLYVLDGTLNVFLPDVEGPSWFELGPGDGFYVPEGAEHQYHNRSARLTEFAFGVAPGYGSDG